MKKEIKKAHSWILYLSRPFNLFLTSVWHEWYASKETKDLFGINLINGLYIENPKGTVGHYRERVQLNKFSESIEELILKNPKKCESLLDEALILNEQAEDILINKKILDLRDSVKFVIKLGLLSTILPYFTGIALEKNNVDNSKITMRVNQLRKTSYYPRIMEEIVTKSAMIELEKRGIYDKNALNVITLNEILGNKKVDIDFRLSEYKKNKTFVYENLNGHEKVDWTDKPSLMINKIEGNWGEESAISGSSAFKGKVKGIVRLVLGNKINAVRFNDGEILVAISTNPELTPLMKKAGAIITDEGGISSHAAIIAREISKPCIVGTKIATKMLHDGDLVEVDANHGEVRVLKRAK